MKTILVIGATGRQGRSVVKYLSSTGGYKILALTRSTTSEAAKELAALPGVSLVESRAVSGYDLDIFEQAARTADGVLVNTDGFSLGEQAETFWGIRLFERAARAGVRHFVYSGLDAIGKATNYDPELYTGHYEGKARVQEWIHAQKNTMPWTIIRSGPYLELLNAVLAPVPDGNNGLHLQLPLHDGAMPFIALDDFGKYTHWAFQHPDESAGQDIGIATAHLTGAAVAAACERRTGKPTRYIDVPIDAWSAEAWKNLPQGPDTKVGFQTVHDSNALQQTFGENFAHWWGLYRATKADNTGLIQRDYALLDRIVPDRLRSIDEWMERVQYSGEKQALLNLEATTG